MKFIVSLLAAAAFLTSCNTTIGMGRDLRILGEQIETSSDKNRRGGGQPAGQQAPAY